MAFFEIAGVFCRVGSKLSSAVAGPTRKLNPESQVSGSEAFMPCGAREGWEEEGAREAMAIGG